MRIKSDLVFSKAFIVLTLFFFLFVFLPYGNEKPRGIHQWAQADRLAIAERFLDGRAVTNPATLSMKTDDGRVGVEFSGYQYIIAQLFRLGINTHYLPFVYRFITLLIFISAFLLLIMKLLQPETFWFRILVFVGLFSSPILLYYGYNFLPDIIALSLILVCLYLMHLNFEKYIFTILLVSGFSMFMKTSSGIYFISFFGIYFLTNFLKWNKKLSFMLVTFLVISLLVGIYDYYFVNLLNKKLYSYVFLSSARTVKNWNEIKEIFTTARRFLMEYFNGAQWTLLSILLIYNIINIKKWKNKRTYIGFSILVLLGLISIIILFGVQYKDHDYYVLSTFMPIILFFAIKTIAQLVEYLPAKTSFTLALLFAIVSFMQGSNRYFNRMSEAVQINGSTEKYERMWLVSADKKIEQYVPKNALVYVVYVPEPNFSLIYINRKGATFNAEEMARKNSPFNWFIKEQKGQYVICNQMFNDTFKKEQKEFLKYTEIIFQDSCLILYKVNGY